MINFIKSQSESTLFIGLGLFLAAVIVPLCALGVVK